MAHVRSQIWLQIAGPMIVMGLVLFGLGAVAAWKVHQLQQTSDQLVARELQSVLKINELHELMRDIRYQLNLYLRSHDYSHLDAISSVHDKADQLLLESDQLVRTSEERAIVERVDRGYASFFGQFEPLAETLKYRPLANPEKASLAHLADELLTEEVLGPLQENAVMHRSAANRAQLTAQQSAQRLKMGLLVLGICGGTAGLLMGVGIARTVGRSIIQLDVSVKSATVRLGEMDQPVIVSHTANLAELESSVRQLEGEIMHAVERMQQSERDLLRAEQLAQVGQLAAGLAHELRNPLMPMKMLVQAALEDQTPLDERSLQIINEEILRLETSIQSLLDFARPPALEKVMVNLGELTQSTIDLVSTRAQSQDVTLELRQAEVLPSVAADPIQIRQVLLNVILNALDSLTNGGRIIVELRAIRFRYSPTTEAAIGQDGSAVQPFSGGEFQAVPSHVMIRIGDDGPGFPPELLDHIFEPFVTTKESGSGLGLSICQRIVTAHRGEMAARNLPSRGAELTILLPIRDVV